ncbi:uracil-DNA glycosylase [Viridibacillus sp. FSL R5-0477]|uniref:Uracil-DNA glycosylase n=1 Tax=Viridibacillus arenosi FSL R5-213 TaxID=1227360 RepID=W4F455_9BACL|nr:MULTISPECIES: uracil-DNA glycosylase [Viridibacillus]ETT87264.1 uracil-DNA glycosylase [Viridibacillus arenosi FSL R5-213]OMC80135.1 uracil-DNA glycosylase [Viridibacillus sp. FSL H8-0123]OMC87905.1 uracil-DNA glycosylase [Viridibacillus sp. FSL H7-0596]OMC91456.1 uracil-DNA glycosylase [Viridibacillus arenosi]
MTKQILDNDWQRVLSTEFNQPYFLQLQDFLENEYATRTNYPPKAEIWNAFRYTPYNDVKVVILGQDPYHGAGQAHGLSFSVKRGVKHPPSLKNMLKEMESDLGFPIPLDGTLTKWAEQGVLMLNTVLTVREGQAHSHKKQGWEQFTDTVIQKLSDREQPIIFVLWGKPAQQKKRLIDTSRHAIIEAPHPSPLSSYRGFFGSKPYSKINAQLREWGVSPIDFDLTK